jgi:hypothetical protein
MNGGSDHNFTAGGGKVGAFRFVHISTLTVATLADVHTGIAKANLVDGQQVMLADQLGGPGVVGYDFSTVIGQHFNQIFGPT